VAVKMENPFESDMEIFLRKSAELFSEDNFELSDMDIWIKKCGNKLVLNYSMQYKMLKHRNSSNLVKLSNDIYMRRRNAGLHVLYKNAYEFISISCNEFNKLTRKITFMDADDLMITGTEFRLRLLLNFQTYHGKGFKRLLVEMTLARIPDNVEYSKQVFDEAYSGIDGKKFYRKCFQYRDCWMYEAFQQLGDFFCWFRSRAQYDLESTINEIMRAQHRYSCVM